MFMNVSGEGIRLFHFKSPRTPLPDILSFRKAVLAFRSGPLPHCAAETAYKWVSAMSQPRQVLSNKTRERQESKIKRSSGRACSNQNIARIIDHVSDEDHVLRLVEHGVIQLPPCVRHGQLLVPRLFREASSEKTIPKDTHVTKKTSNCISHVCLILQCHRSARARPFTVVDRSYDAPH